MQTDPFHPDVILPPPGPAVRGQADRSVVRVEYVAATRAERLRLLDELLAFRTKVIARGARPRKTGGRTT